MGNLDPTGRSAALVATRFRAPGLGVTVTWPAVLIGVVAGLFVSYGANENQAIGHLGNAIDQAWNWLTNSAREGYKHVLSIIQTDNQPLRLTPGSDPLNSLDRDSLSQSQLLSFIKEAITRWE